jgi:hypothetical protein
MINTTEQKYTEIRSDLWDTMTVSELVDQRNLLTNRLDLLRANGYRFGHSVANNLAILTGSLEQGLREIDTRIERLNGPSNTGFYT